MPVYICTYFQKSPSFLQFCSSVRSNYLLLQRCLRPKTYQNNLCKLGSGHVMSSQRNTSGLIPGKEETLIWTVYHVAIALLSLFGDTIILVGTTKYKAIKLHRVIVVIIQHLAAADLMLTFSRVVPIIVSLIGGGWVLGNFLCSVNFGLAYVVTPTMCILTCVLVISKLMIVQYPFLVFSTMIVQYPGRENEVT